MEKMKKIMKTTESYDIDVIKLRKRIKNIVLLAELKSRKLKMRHREIYFNFFNQKIRHFYLINELNSKMATKLAGILLMYNLFKYRHKNLRF
jgi:hypothetical protein